MPIRLHAHPATLSITPIPFEQMAYGLEKEEKRRDEADKLYTDLESEFSKIKAIKDIDSPKRDERLNQYRNMVSGLYDQSKGDPNSMLSGLRQIRSKFIQDATYGDLGQMHQKAIALEQAQEDYKKASTDGKFSGLDDLVYNAAILKPLQEYAAVGGHGRDDKGFTTNLNLGSMPKLPEVGEKLSAFAQQWAATEYGGKLQPSDTPGYFVTTNGKMVSEDEVMRGVSDYLFSAPEFRTVNKLIADATPDNFTTEIKNSEGKVVQNLTGAAAGVYNFYKGTIKGIAERESFVSATPSYIKDEGYWRNLDKKEKEEANWGTTEQGAGPTIENLTGISNDFFSMIPKGTTEKTYDYTGGMATKSPWGRVVSSTKTTTENTYKDPATLAGKEKSYFEMMLNSLPSTPGLDNLKPIVDKYNRGEKLSNSELGLVYPHIQIMNTAINKVQKSNTSVQSIVRPEERKQANEMFGTSGDAAISVKQLGTGQAGNRKVIDVTTGKEMTYAELIQNLKENPVTAEALITISGKVRGPNPWALITNNNRYAHGYQFHIGGKPYIMEGAVGYSNAIQKDETDESIFLNEVTKAQFTPGIKYKQTFPTGDIDFAYIYNENPNNPDEGFYQIVNIQLNPQYQGELPTKASEFAKQIMATPIPDATGINETLRSLAILLNTKQ